MKSSHVSNVVERKEEESVCPGLGLVVCQKPSRVKKKKSKVSRRRCLLSSKCSITYLRKKKDKKRNSNKPILDVDFR